MSTSQEIGERTVAHTESFMTDDWSVIEAASADPFKRHIGAIAAALPMPVRSIDVKHVWRSGSEWHVEAEVVGDESTRMLLLRYLDGETPTILGGAVRSS